MLYSSSGRSWKIDPPWKGKLKDLECTAMTEQVLSKHWHHGGTLSGRRTDGRGTFKGLHQHERVGEPAGRRTLYSYLTPIPKPTDSNRIGQPDPEELILAGKIVPPIGPAGEETPPPAASAWKSGILLS